jgi:hypothetical protein
LGIEIFGGGAGFPAVQRPMALGFQTDEIAQLITLEL